MRQLPSGGFALASNTQQGPSLLLLDGDGRVLLSRKIVQSLAGELQGFTSTPDGGFVVTGTSRYRTNKPRFSYFSKLDKSAKVIWTQQIQTEGMIFNPRVVAANDGSLLMCGRNELGRAWVAKFNSTGRITWEKYLVRSGQETIPMGLCLTPDGGVALAGQLDRDLWVIRLSATGEVLWSRTYGGDERSGANSIASRADGSLVVAGLTRSFGAIDYDGWILAIGDEGDVIWQFRAGGNGLDVFHDAVISDDNGVWVVGTWQNDPNGATKTLLLHLSRSGGVLSQTAVEPKSVTIGALDRDSKNWMSVDSTLSGGAVVATNIGKPFPSLFVYTVDTSGALGPGCFLAHATDVSFSQTDAVVRDKTTESFAAPVQTKLITAQQEDQFIAEAAVCAPIRNTQHQGPDQAQQPQASHPGSEAKKAPEDPPSWFIDPAPMLLSKQFAELDNLANRFLKTRQRRPDGEWILKVFYDLLEPTRSAFSQLGQNEFLDLAREWIATRPNSVPARIVLDNALRNFAWGHRGRGFSNTVTDKGQRQFSHLQQEIFRDLQEAGRLHPKDPQYFVSLLESAHLTGQPPQTLRTIFENGFNLEKEYYRLYVMEAGFHRPQWGGKPGEVGKFATTMEDRIGGKLGEEIYARIAMAWLPTAREKIFTEYGFDWPELRKGLVVIRERFPGSQRNIHLSLRLACLARDRAFARELFDLPEAKWINALSYIWGNRARYEKQRKWALAPQTSESEPFKGNSEAHSETTVQKSPDRGFLLRNGLRFDPSDARATISRNDFELLIKELLSSHRYDDLERLEDLLSLSRLRFPDGTWMLAGFYHSLKQILLVGSSDLRPEEAKQLIQAWRESNPQSRRASALSLLASFSHPNQEAARMTPEAARQQRESLCSEVMTLVEPPSIAAKDDPGLTVELIELSRRCHASRDRIKSLFEKAVSLHSSYEPLYLMVANILGGQPGSPELEAFAAGAATETKSELGDTLYSLILYSNSVFRSFKKQGQFDFDWARLRSGFQEYLTRYQDTFRYRAFFVALACEQHDYETVRRWIDTPDLVCNGWVGIPRPTQYRSSGIWETLEINCETCREHAYMKAN